MNDDDRAYWDDDPMNPMPGKVEVSIPALVFPVKSNPSILARFERDSVAQARVALEQELERHAAWWRRRIRRERERPSPHSDTETIAYNIDH